MIAVATDIGDKINHELRSYGANIAVTPQADTLDVRIGGVDLKPASDGSYMNEADLPEIKGIFWRNNIEGFAPFLPVPTDVTSAAGTVVHTELVGTYFEKHLRYGKEEFTTGVRKISPWWKVAGAWPTDDSQRCARGFDVGRDRCRQGWRSRPTLAIVRCWSRGILNTGGIGRQRDRRAARRRRKRCWDAQAR